jgi:hypothetical protein
MLYNQKDIPELNVLFHRNDSTTKKYLDYEKVILDKSLSPYLYSNSRMAKFLTMLNGLVSLFFDQFNVLKNFKNFTVDKYYYKGTN